MQWMQWGWIVCLNKCVDVKACTNYKIKLNIADRRMFEYFTFFPEIDSFFRVYSSLYFFPFRAFPCPLNRQNRFNGPRLLWTSNPFMKVFTSDDGRIDFSTWCGSMREASTFFWEGFFRPISGFVGNNALREDISTAIVSLRNNFL